MSLEGLLSCNIKVENRSISFADILACRVPQGTSVAELRLVLERLGPVVESNPDYQSLKSAGLVLPAMECFKLVPASSWSPEDVKDYLMLYYPDLVGDCDAEELKSITGRHLLEAKVLPAIPQRVWSEIAQSHKSVGTRAGARYFTSHLCKIPSDLGDLVGEHANALPSLNKTQLPEAATKTDDFEQHGEEHGLLKHDRFRPPRGDLGEAADAVGSPREEPAAEDVERDLHAVHHVHHQGSAEPVLGDVARHRDDSLGAGAFAPLGQVDDREVGLDEPHCSSFDKGVPVLALTAVRRNYPEAQVSWQCLL